MSQRAATRALDEDSRKAALASAQDNLQAAQTAIQHRRLPTALIFLLKAAQKQRAEALPLIGDVLLELQLGSAAEVAYHAAIGSSPNLHAAVGLALALSSMQRPITQVRKACTEAQKLCTAPDKQRLAFARLLALDGAPDQALECALLASGGLQPGDPTLNAAVLFASEMEFAMYAEAAWPQSMITRQEREHDGELPEGIELPIWRLQ